MIKKITLLLVLVSIIFFAKQSDAQFNVVSKAGDYLPSKNEGIIDPASWEAIPSLRQHKYILIQFSVLPDESQMKKLQERSIELLTYLPTNTFIAKVPASYAADRFTNLSIVSAGPIAAVNKIHRRVKVNEVPSYALDNGNYKLMITLHPGLAASDILDEIKAHHASILDIYNEQHITLSIHPAYIHSLAAHTEIQFVDFINPPMEKENILNQTDHRSNILNADYGAGRHYDGSGVRVALTDDGFIGPHIDYEGRTNQNAVLTVNGGDHGDHCAGTIMGAGNLDPQGRGMAPAVDLWVYQAIPSNNYILNDSLYTSPYTSIDIVSTSYSDGCNDGYNAGAESADRQIRTFKNVMRVFSAGNNGTQNCNYGAGGGWGNITGGIKMAKNLIAVANLTYTDVVANSSSRGPADDGRIKPDVSAVGTDVYSTIDPNDYGLKTGTSMSCPGVAGVFAQLYQAYRELNGGNDPRTGLLKGIMMNTCDDIGNPGPDFKHGYGRINGLRAVKTLESNQYIRDSISTGGTKTITINVPPNTQRVKIMLNWMDREAAVAATTALVNDLDLVVNDPASANFLPWKLDHTPIAANLNANAIRAADHLNNAEQVTIDNPLPGAYSVVVNGFAVPFGPQEYYISYEFIANDALEMTYPIGGEGFIPGEIQTIRWNAIHNGQTFDLDYSTDNGASWNNMTVGIPAAQTYYNWSVPSTSSGNCKVRVIRGTALSTSPDRFSILQVPANLSLVRVCPDTITIKWSAVTGATSYEVYSLGNKYMDSVGTTTDTFYHFAGLNMANAHWFSVRSKSSANAAISRRAFAIEQVPGLFNCVLQNDAIAESNSSPGNTSMMSCASISSIPVNITIKNNGLNPISNLNLGYRLNSLTPVNEVYTGTIVPGATYNYTFTTGLSSLSTGSNTLKVWTALSGDLYHLNDTLSNEIIWVNSSIASLPWTQTFESTSTCPTVAECDYTSCNLSNGLHNEKNGVSDQFDWKVYEGSTPTTVTGPDVDHTTGTATGNYIYTESSYCFNQNAYLSTPCFSFSTTSKPYLHFWYHMYGTNIGSLRVDAFANGAWQPNIMTPLVGNKGNTWLKATVDLSNFVGQTVYFRIIGLTGADSKSDIAIDDISVVDSAVANSVADPSLAFSVYPNPVSHILEISTNQSNLNFETAEIYNLLGERIIVYQNKSSQPRMSLDLSSFASGLYWLVLRNAEGIVYKQKLMKQ